MSKSDKHESIDDIKPRIHPDLLSYLQIVAGIVGLILVVCFLYIPVNPWSKAIVIVIGAVVAVVIIVHGVATINDGDKAKRTVEFIETKYPDSSATLKLATADYETLEAMGQDQLEREKQEEEEAKAKSE